MQTHELLDRFELLYPDNTALSDLRRAYIEKDVSSIVRIIDKNNKDFSGKYVRARAHRGNGAFH